MSNKLPKDWKWVKMGDIVTLSSLKHSPIKPEDLFYIGLEHIEKHTGKLTSKVGLDKITTIKNKFSKGDILYGKLRPNLNKVYLSKEEGVCSTDILVLKLSNECLGKYLHPIMFSTPFVNKMSDNTSGVNLPRVSTKFILNYEIPLPPLETQHAIVSKIEELFSELDKGIEDLKTAQLQLKTYRQSVLKYAFEGKLTNKKVKDGVLPKGWKLENLNNVSKIVSGFAFKSSDFISIGIPVIKISNVGYSEFIWKDQKYLSKEFLASNSDFILKGGDLLIALTRPITNNTTKICRFPQNI
ncbi:MAG: restriction endonuclease S subunit, partial [Saprospiraceae bacterium]